MLFFWNRAEIYLGYSLEEFQRRRKCLEDGGIPTDSRVMARTGGGGFSSTWDRAAQSGLNRDYCSQYYLYVAKKDVGRAHSLLARLGEESSSQK